MPLNIVCISASNIAHQTSDNSTSYRICKIVASEIARKIDNAKITIIELRNKPLHPCIGCGACFESHRCVHNDDFNKIYVEIIKADIVFIISPHYAPIPAKLAALFEKMEQITFLHWGKSNSYKSEVWRKPTGIISHGGGWRWALKSYKNMVNDTIANALDTIQMKVVPFNDEWNTGISLPVKNVTFHNSSIFPSQEYDWDLIADKISAYTNLVIQEKAD